MSNPRAVAFTDGMFDQVATFIIDNSTITYSVAEVGGSAQVGLAVALSAAKTIELAGDGEEIIGKLLGVEADNTASVQIGGVVTLPGGNGAALTPGKKIVGALDAASAEGYIREANTATAAELGVARGFIIDAGTTTAVAVML